MKLPRGILFDLDDTILMAFGPARSQWRRTITAFADRLGPTAGWRRTSAERAHGHALRVWLDEAEIPLGGSIPGHINRGLEISRFALLLMTPAYFESSSGWTDAEWHAALNEDPDNRQHRLIPAMGADCPYIPYLLRHLRGADLRGDKYDNGLREILRALKGEPLPRPVTHRGQLIAPSGKIDRSQLVAERSVLDASPDAISEILQCNLCFRSSACPPA